MLTKFIVGLQEIMAYNGGNDRNNGKNYIWISLQANVLNDVTSTEFGFVKEVQKMLKTLEDNYTFFIPQLSLNMRNSSNISECAKRIKQDYPKNLYHINEGVVNKLSTLTTSVTSSVPLLIPISSSDFNIMFNEALTEVIDSFDNNCVILHSNLFTSAQIEKALTKNNTISNSSIFCHD